MMFKRKALYQIKKRLFEKRKFIQVILGPRQVGKTTLAEQLSDEIDIPKLFVSTDAVPPSNSMWIEQQWETARLKLESSPKKQFLLIIDEIQKIQNWSEVVKKNWDLDSRNKRNVKVLLLGSSNISIQTGLTESLAGRFETTYLTHWSLKEMSEAFDFTPEQYVFFGGYPGAAGLINDEKRWSSYIHDSIIETTISKDILQLTKIYKPALLKNLFELSCKYAGEILSYTKLLGQLHDAGNTTTLSHYQNLLNKSWMITGLEKFSGSDVIIKRSVPKWITYNTALSSAYSELGFTEALSELSYWGRLVERAVGSYLLNQSQIKRFDLYYWRESNNEIDFILKRNKKIVSIEVKTSKKSFHSGIEKFNKKFKTHRNILISQNSLDWKEFLSLDIDSLFN